MLAPKQRSSRDVAHMLFVPFVARFIADGNVYRPEDQSRFTFEEREALKKQYPGALTTGQCYDFARNAYLLHEGETAFRAYIGVHAPGKNVRKMFQTIFNVNSGVHDLT